MKKYTFEEILAENKELVFTNTGTSMMPLLREGRDVMVIRSVPDRDWKKYDAVLYIRPQVTGRGRYVLHRIIRKNEDGSYYIVGDHCVSGENVPEENMIGRLESVIRNGRELNFKSFQYRLYRILWCDLFPARCFLLKVKARLHRIKRKVRGRG